MLSKIIIPRLMVTAHYILGELNDKERDDGFRLKRVTQTKSERQMQNETVHEENESEIPKGDEKEVPLEKAEKTSKEEIPQVQDENKPMGVSVKDAMLEEEKTLLEDLETFEDAVDLQFDDIPDNMTIPEDFKIPGLGSKLFRIGNSEEEIEFQAAEQEPELVEDGIAKDINVSQNVTIKPGDGIKESLKESSITGVQKESVSGDKLDSLNQPKNQDEKRLKLEEELDSAVRELEEIKNPSNLSQISTKTEKSYTKEDKNSFKIIFSEEISSKQTSKPEEELTKLEAELDTLEKELNEMKNLSNVSVIKSTELKEESNQQKIEEKEFAETKKRRQSVVIKKSPTASKTELNPNEEEQNTTVKKTDSTTLQNDNDEAKESDKKSSSKKSNGTKNKPDKKDEGPGDGKPDGGGIVLRAEELIRISDVILPFEMLTLETMNEFDELFDGELDYLDNLPEIVIPEKETTLASSTMPKDLSKLKADKTKSALDGVKLLRNTSDKEGSNKVIVIDNKKPIETSSAIFATAERTLEAIKNLMLKMKYEKESKAAKFAKNKNITYQLSPSNVSNTIFKLNPDATLNIKTDEDKEKEVRVIPLCCSDLNKRSQSGVSNANKESIKSKEKSMDCIDVKESAEKYDVKDKKCLHLEFESTPFGDSNKTSHKDEKNNNPIKKTTFADLEPEIVRTYSNNNTYCSPARSSYSLPKIKSLEEVDEKEYEENTDFEKENKIFHIDSKVKLLKFKYKNLKFMSPTNVSNKSESDVYLINEDVVLEDIDESKILELSKQSNEKFDNVLDKEYLSTESLQSNISLQASVIKISSYTKSWLNDNDNHKIFQKYDVTDPTDRFLCQIYEDENPVLDLTFADLDSEKHDDTNESTIGSNFVNEIFTEDDEFLSAEDISLSKEDNHNIEVKNMNRSVERLFKPLIIKPSLVDGNNSTEQNISETQINVRNENPEDLTFKTNESSIASIVSSATFYVHNELCNLERDIECNTNGKENKEKRFKYIYDYDKNT